LRRRARPRDDSGSDRQDQLPADVPFAEGAERVLRLGELVGPVDRGLEPATFHQIGQRLEVRLVEARYEELDRVLAEARREPDGCKVPQLVAAAVAADDHEPAVRLENSAE